MSLIDVEALFLGPAALLVYWLLPARRGAQNAWLLACSYGFYASWSSALLGLLVAGTLLDYALGRYLDAERASPRRAAALGASLAFNLGALAFFKYHAFFAPQLNALLAQVGLAAHPAVLSLALPLGISFYTLQRIGYVVDVYWGRQAACRSLLDFALFVAYFPQITAGPISRAAELLPQLARARRWSGGEVLQGARELLVGYALKAWAGNTIGARLVDPVFAASASYDAASHWWALFGYAAQVFCDFAGYSLIAIGVSRAFGIALPQNFDFPFLSRSLPELWRRWHITLNRWLFDYIFTPLTTSHGWFRNRVAVALLLTFLASGLWHGGNWTFVVWGALHGLGMIAHGAWDERYRAWCRADRSFVALRRSAGYAVAAWALTSFFFVLTLVPFRAADLGSAAAFLARMGGAEGPLSATPGVNAGLALAFVAAYHLLSLRPAQPLRERLAALPDALRGFAYGSALVFLLLQTPPGTGAFIYQQF